MEKCTGKTIPHSNSHGKHSFGKLLKSICSDPRAIRPFLFGYTAVHIGFLERPLCVISFLVTGPLGISSPSLIPSNVGLNKGCIVQLEHSHSALATIRLSSSL